MRFSAASRPRDKCGIFALYNYRGPGNAALAAYLGLLAIQHRGQESAGMVYAGPGGLRSVKGMGLVDHVFTRESLEAVKAETVLGHVRYSTTGSSSAANAQPLVARSYDRSGIALAHNGNLTNTRRLHDRLLEEGHIFHTTSDTEIMLAYLFRLRRFGLAEAVRKTMEVVEGAYAAVVMDERQLVAFRDPNGFRPLVMGLHGEAVVFASETAALDCVGASFCREVGAGEIITAGSGGLSALEVGSAGRKSLCIFEYVYFARPDSVIGGKCVHEVRRAAGSLLAARFESSVDMIIPSPDSGVSAAIGMAEALKRPLEWAVYRNPYLGRTFIEPTQDEREVAVRLKFNPIRDLVRGKKVAVVDDSLVRGTTARVLVALLRAAGACEVHMCIASPPYSHPCYYGIDIPAAVNLASPGAVLGDPASAVGADSVTYAVLEDLYAAVGVENGSFCDACFTGNYPTLGAVKGRVN